MCFLSHVLGVVGKRLYKLTLNMSFLEVTIVGSNWPFHICTLSNIQMAETYFLKKVCVYFLSIKPCFKTVKTLKDSFLILSIY